MKNYAVLFVSEKDNEEPRAEARGIFSERKNLFKGRLSSPPLRAEYSRRLPDKTTESVQYNLNLLDKINLINYKIVFIEKNTASDSLVKYLKEKNIEFKIYKKNNNPVSLIYNYLKDKDTDLIIKLDISKKVFIEKDGIISQAADKITKDKLDYVKLDYGRYFSNWSSAFRAPVEVFTKTAPEKLDKLLSKNQDNYSDFLKDKLRNLQTAYIPENVFKFYKNVTDNMKDVIPFPGSLCVEITNHCNLNCTVCYCRNMVRPKIHMGVNLIKKIIDGAAKYPQTRIIPNLSGESLTHPDFFEIVKYAKNKGFKSLAIDSNGLLLGGRNLEKVFESGLDDIGISVNAIRPETYEKIVNSDIKKLFKVVDDILEKRKLSPDLKPSLLVQLVEDDVNKGEIKEYVDYWLNKLTPGHDAVCIKKQMDPEGRFVDRSLAENLKVPCYKMWYQLVILSSGEAVMCGFDYDSRFLIGDAKKESLYDIWHGSRMMEYRMKHIENKFNEINICAPCEINQEFIPGKQVKQTTDKQIILTESQMFKIYQKQSTPKKKKSFLEKVLAMGR